VIVALLLNFGQNRDEGLSKFHQNYVQFFKKYIFKILLNYDTNSF
jgi:hypothetical protein